MHDINPFVLIFSTDVLFISLFIGLSYIIGHSVDQPGFRNSDSTSMNICIPWLIAIFLFLAPSLSFLTGTNLINIIGVPITIVALIGAICLQSHKEPFLSPYCLISVKQLLLKPVLSLLLMFFLRDILHLSYGYLITLTLVLYSFILFKEISQERHTVNIAGVLYNFCAICFLIGTFVQMHQHNFEAPIFAIVGAILGLFASVIYQLDHHFKSQQHSNNQVLFERFEEIVSETKFQTALDISEDGLWAYHFETDTMMVSIPLMHWVGLTKAEIKTAADFWISRVHPQDWNKIPLNWMPENFKALREKLRALNGESHEFEIRLKDHQNQYKWVRLRMKVSRERQHTHIYGSFKDIDTEKHAHAQIAQLSLYDMTTGLPNFSSLVSSINDAVHSGRAHSLLFINIDNFKTINDLLGIFKGDEILSQISQRLSEILPDEAMLYRFGGDEFVVITSKVEESEHLADMIRLEFDRRLNWNDSSLRITCSIGVCNFPGTYASDVESILKCADIAMEHAKRTGKNKYVTYTSSMMADLEYRHKMIRAMEESLCERDFEVYYQALHHHTDTSKLHAEALLRWNWDNKAVSPAEFIPIAEETGLVIPLGKMVLDQVCRDIAMLQASGQAFYVSLNVSAVQLRHLDFKPFVKQALEAHCIDPSHLTIEITETSLLHDTFAVKKTLDELRELGLRVSLDDFGTGYSSLSHILQLPIDELKLDRSFIKNLHQDIKRQNVISNIIQLAHSMDMMVIAEGVEVKDEADMLIKFGCDVCQGYYYAYPTPLKQLIQTQVQSKSKETTA